MPIMSTCFKNDETDVDIDKLQTKDCLLSYLYMVSLNAWWEVTIRNSKYFGCLKSK